MLISKPTNMILKICLLTVLPFIILAFDSRPKQLEAILRRATHPGVSSAFNLAQQVVTHFQDHKTWLSHFAAGTVPSCANLQLQNCSNSANAAAYFECFASNLQSIINDCVPEISDPDQLFDMIEDKLQNNLQNKKQISAVCSSDLSFHWTTLIKFVTANAVEVVCAGQTNNGNCTDLLKWAPKALGESAWALTPIDASAKVPPGFAEGNFHWDGSFKQCRSINQHGDKGKFVGQYCNQAIGFPAAILGALFGASNNAPSSDAMTTDPSAFTTPNYSMNTTTIEPKGSSNCHATLLLTVGTCMPDSCSNEDVNRASDILTFGTLSKMGLLCNAHCVPNEKTLPKSADTILWLVLAGVVLAIALFGSCYDFFVYRPQMKAAENPNAAFELQPTFGKVLIAFSFYTNLKRLLEMKKRNGQVHCLHGIRSLSTTWVICGHVYIYAIEGDNQISAIKTIPKQFINLAITNATVSVDTFFLLSGFLLSYLWLKEMDRSKGKKLTSVHFWVMYYVHRYLRLTPLLAVIVWGSVSVFPYIAEGAYYNPSTDIEVQFCRDNWWATLLYINNVYKPDEECYAVTWYLSNDTQFYVLAPIVLMLFYKYPKVGTAVCVFLLAACAATRAWVTVDHNFAPTDTITANLALAYSPDYFSLMYVPPWTRHGPYVVGLLLGFIMYKLSLRKKPFKMNSWIALIGWLLAAGICSAVLFGLYNYSRTGEMSLGNRALYSALHRTAWVIGVAWVIFACHTGYGGIVDRFLSWPVFIPLSRLTYASYLLHWTLLTIYFGTLDRNVHWDDIFHWTTLVIGIVIWATLFSIPFSCLFELPILTLEKILFHPPQNNVKPKQTQNGNGVA